METYHIIDKYNRNVTDELKIYTFNDVKNFFEPPLDDNELIEYHKKWESCSDLFELNEYLQFEYGGMEIPYEIVENDE